MKRNEFRWRLLKQSLLQKKAKALLILLAVTMGASVVSALLNVQTDLRSRMNRELRDYGPNVVIVPGNNQVYLPEKYLRNVEQSQVSKKIIASTPQLFAPVKVGDFSAVLVGANLLSLRKLYPSQDWTPPPANSNPGEIFVGKRLARKMNLSVNSKILVKTDERQMELKVAGLVESGESEDDQLFADLDQAQQLVGSGTRYQSILLSVLGDLPQVRSEFDGLVFTHPGAEFHLIRKIAATESSFLDKLSRLIGLVISLIFIILFFCIHTTVSTILISRQSEIALLRVLGARRKQIAGALSSELLLLGGLGGICGYGLGILMSQVLGKVLFQSYITPSFIIFLITLLFSLSLMVVSSIFPILRAVNRQAALILKEA
jgi:putative ABC transport system permease protein